MNPFTMDEMNLMLAYGSLITPRDRLISTLTDVLSYLDEDEEELRRLTQTVLRKLRSLSPADYFSVQEDILLLPMPDLDEMLL